MFKYVKNCGTKLLDTLFPAHCFLCQEILTENVHLCAKCWGDVDFITSPFCQICGMPFSFEVGAETLCGSCIKETPAYDKMRVVAHYGGAMRKLILPFKHGDKTELVSIFADWLHKAGQEIFGECDVIVPVPLHFKRLLMRRYNQAGLLANELSKKVNIPVDHFILSRHKYNSTQKDLSRKERFRNLQGAFQIKNKSYIKGKNLLIIDDVVTTGATAQSCASLLKHSGAKKVEMLALARVV
jgi:ComF family protein